MQSYLKENVMGHVLGTKSLAELQGVHPKLVECVKIAITRTQQDFGVHDEPHWSAWLQ